MIRIMVLSAAMLLMGVSALFAQQDPDDPGMQDSLIFWCPNDHVDSADIYQFRILREIAVTHDSIYYCNIPLSWHAPLGGVTCGPGIFYYPPFDCEDGYDTAYANQNWIRQIYGAIGDCPPLFTNGVRLNFIWLRFIIAPNTPSQLVVFDTCWDDRNGSVFYCLPNDIGFIPAVQRGFLSIGSVGVTGSEPVPDAFSLSQNYPNPFNAATTIEFALPYGGRVRLEVFDILGREVATLIDVVSNPGAYAIQWRGRDDGGNGVPSGVYFYRLSAGGFVETKRMLLLK